MGQPVAANQSPAPEACAGPPETVLVVDDSKAQRRILSSNLTRWGYAVLEAGSGAAALAICDAQVVDLIVSVWMMPGMTGLDLCEAFRARRDGRYGYFILLTSKSEKVEIARGLDVGADDFLTKPVTATEFRARLRAGERILQMEQDLAFCSKSFILSHQLLSLSTLLSHLSSLISHLSSPLSTLSLSLSLPLYLSIYLSISHNYIDIHIHTYIYIGI